ncbi:MAG: alpha/beta hydrolase fold [Ilumatobacteraceae bacterium]|nr:alpha/beta hydrolase fold [Ilumatobacteraceae bacterium]
MTESIDAPWEPAPGSDEGYALFAKERRVLADDGTPIAYTFRNPDGPGIPVVFANGWSCSDAYWGTLLPRLEAAGHPCLLPDTRGHGRSGLPRPPGRGARDLSIDDVSMPRIARDLVTVMDDAGVRDALVIGHSMGVQTALEAYRQIPDRILGLVLIAGTASNPAKTFYGTSLGDLVFPIGAAIVRVFPEVLAPVWATIGAAAPGHIGARLVRAAGPKATREELHPYLLHVRSVDPAVIVLMASAMRAHDATDLLPDITVPTLVAAAGADVFTPARCSEAIHHAVVGSELITFAAAGHTLPIEEPEALAAAIGDFVARRIAVKPKPEPKPRARTRRTS